MPQLALAFLLADVWVQHWSRLPTTFEWMLLVFTTLVLGFRRNVLGVTYLMGVVWAAIFGFWCLQDQLDENLQQRDLKVQGYIVSIGHEDRERAGFDFIVTNSIHGVPRKLRLNWFHPRQALVAGQGWQMTVRLKRPHGHLNPGGFDYQAWLFANSIGATGYVRNRPEPIPLELGFYPQKALASWRHSMAQRIESVLPHSPYLGMIQALSLGNQHKIDPSQWMVLRTTGVMHLIVISGSHISLVAGLVFFIIRKLWILWGGLRFAPHQVAALTAWSFAVAYAALAGFSIPTQRALVMLTVVLLALVMQRNVSIWHTLSLALLAVLCFDPLAVLSVGFWLSFTSVALLMYVSGDRLGRPGFWKEAIHSQWVVVLGLSPLLIACFQQVSLIAPLANWLAVPWIGLIIVPLCLLGLLGSFVSLIFAGSVFKVIDWQLDVLYSVLVRMSEWPWAMVSFPQPGAYALLCGALGVGLILAPRGFPGRVLGVFLLLPLFFPRSEKLEYGEAQMTLLDVGQGLSVVLQTAQHAILYDTGARFAEQSDMGASVVLPYLLHQGINKIDDLIISHGDNDHSGGAVAVLAALPVDRLFSSVAEFAEGQGRQYCRAGQQWEWDGVVFTMLSPADKAFEKENDNSCVLKMSTSHWSALLTGDIEHLAESELLKTDAEKLASDVLIAPHHGSKTSSSPEFLRSVAPKVVLIPAGKLNRFGFPHRQVLARYRILNAPWYIQGEQGAIRVTHKAGELMIDSECRKRIHYWMQNDLCKT